MAPRNVYKLAGEWISTGDRLGTNSIKPGDQEYGTFKKAKAFVHKLKIPSVAQWRLYAKSGEKPVDIPASPYQVYSADWKSWIDWLGTSEKKR